jgi:hypothetical protein
LKGRRWCERIWTVSGSTLIAAEQTGRKAFLMELDTLYCDVIVQRWQAFTGQRATRRSPAIGVEHGAEEERSLLGQCLASGK